MDIDVLTLIVTSLVSVVIGLFGKERFEYLTSKKKLEVNQDYETKIKTLETHIAEERIRMERITTGIDMILTMFEQEFSTDNQYQAVIEKVRTFINQEISVSEESS